MKWIILAVIIIGIVIYLRRKSSVTLTKDQTEMVKGLIDEKLNNLDEQRQGIIDRAAANGKTVPLESLFSKLENEPESVKQEAEKIKKDLCQKYGENLPVDVVYQLMKEWDSDA
jgi:type III secretory pathway component EscV